MEFIQSERGAPKILFVMMGSALRRTITFAIAFIFTAMFENPFAIYPFLKMGDLIGADRRFDDGDLRGCQNMSGALIRSFRARNPK